LCRKIGKIRYSPGGTLGNSYTPSTPEFDVNSPAVPLSLIVACRALCGWNLLILSKKPKPRSSDAMSLIRSDATQRLSSHCSRRVAINSFSSLLKKTDLAMLKGLFVRSGKPVAVLSNCETDST